MYRYNSVCPQSPERKGRSGEDKDISQGYFAGFQCHDSKIDQNKKKPSGKEKNLNMQRLGSQQFFFSKICGEIFYPKICMEKPC